MIGLIFNEFLDFADAQRPGRGRTLLGIVGRATAQRYEPYEHYDYDELLTLTRIVARGEGVMAGEILRRFGTRLFERLPTLCPAFRDRGQDAFTFLRRVVELNLEGVGLGAAAERLCLRCREIGLDFLELEYSSVHNLADLAEGMIRGCITHFGGGVELERHDLSSAPGRAARFVLVARHCESPSGPPLENRGKIAALV